MASASSVRVPYGTTCSNPGAACALALLAITTPCPNASPTAGVPVGAPASEEAWPGFTDITTMPLPGFPHVERVISNPSAATAKSPDVQSAVSPHALRTTTPAGAPTARTCARYRLPLVSPVTSWFVADTPLASNATVPV